MATCVLGDLFVGIADTSVVVAVLGAVAVSVAVVVQGVGRTEMIFKV